jgi:hypothetical protein
MLTMDCRSASSAAAVVFDALSVDVWPATEQPQEAASTSKEPNRNAALFIVISFAHAAFDFARAQDGAFCSGRAVGAETGIE